MEPPVGDVHPDSQRRLSTVAVQDATHRSRPDVVAVEEPMEIRVTAGPQSQRETHSISVTMRTPGDDHHLAVGFLVTEGILSDPKQIQQVVHCGPAAPGLSQSNIVRVDLQPDVAVDLKRLKRNFYATSSCGLCGKASLEALDFSGYAKLDSTAPHVTLDAVHALPDKLRVAQDIFDETGGVHAAGLFSAAGGELLAIAEDVGRHNAVDKLIGRQFLAGALPLSQHVMVLSGRISFEVLQKGLSAGIPVVVAVGAPSSLAISMAERFGVSVVGFARDGRFNIYAGEDRILGC